MRRIIEIDVLQDEAIALLVAKGKYRDAQHFLSSAIETQLLIEQADTGSLLSETDSGIRVAESGPSYGDNGRSGPELTLTAIKTIPPLEEGRIEGGDDPTRWLWGQVNSVLGIKFACRQAAHSVGGTSKPLKELVSDVATKAAAFGDYLRSLDKEHGRSRGDSLSVSFPTLAPARKEKSIDRFGFHYIGYRRQDGKYDGALFQLGLLSVDADGNPWLTQAGAKFAVLPNPVIDSQGNPGWLSREEEMFYLAEIAAQQPQERRPLSWMLDAIASGADERLALNRRLSAAREGKWTAAQVETYRVGTLSRMVQLRVLAVSRTGRDFRYSLGANAKTAEGLFSKPVLHGGR